MRIGFDAKRAYQNNTGLGHYSRTLISSLAKFYPHEEYFLFAPRQTDMYDTSVYPAICTITPQTFPSSLFRSAWRSSWVKKDLLEQKIDLYHGLSHEIPAGIHNTGIKSVVTIHDLIFERYPEQYNAIDVFIYRKKFRYSCKHADRIIAISEQTKRDIIEFYKIPEEKIIVCYQSCNPSFGIEVSSEEKKRIRSLYQLPEKFFLYVGSIIERKNLLTIVKAINKLKEKSPIPLVVIGDGGSYKEKVKAYIKENSLSERIIFLSEKESLKSLPSFRSANDFPAIYQMATAMIYPSIFEGFGIPVLEALWSKLPVITTNLSCLPETGGDAAIYVDPFNENQMADAMYTIINNTEVADDMRTRGWRHAHQFTQEKCAAGVMNVYKELVR
ncbi:MAG: glycosyltransferase family 4 protein [Sphingobacteriales bacterium]